MVQRNNDDIGLGIDRSASISTTTLSLNPHNSEEIENV